MTRRDRTLLSVVLTVAVLAAFYLLVLSPRRSQISTLNGEINAQQQKLDAARADLAAGQQAKARYASDYATVARLGKAVPTDDQVPSLLYEIQQAAAGTHISFASIQITGTGASSSAGLVSSAAASAANFGSHAPGASTSGSTSSTSGSASTTSGSASTTSGSTGATSPTSAGSVSTAAAALGQLPPGAVVGPAGFPVMPFSFTFEGDFFHLDAFFRHIERFIVNRRSGLVVSGRLLTLDSIQLGPDGNQPFPHIKATVSAQGFLLPSSQGLFDGASASGPTAVTAPASLPATTQ